jgi:hypothetical protein
MAHAAGLLSEFDHSLFANDVAREGHNASIIDGRFSDGVPGRIADIIDTNHRTSPGFRIVGDRSIEYDLACADPIGGSPQPRSV